MKKCQYILLIIFIILLLIISIKNIFSNNHINKDILLGDSNIIGDVDDNGKINTTDYLLVRKHILGTSTLNTNQQKRADTNQDGKINTSDYIMIRKNILYGITIPQPTNSESNTNPSQSSNSGAGSNSNQGQSSSNTPNQTSTVESKIHFIRTGDSDAILIESDGHFGLVDAARSSDNVDNYLKSVGVGYLDFVIATHLHDDHIGGMVAVANKYVNSKTNFYYRNITSGYSTGEDYSLLTKVVNAMKNNKAILHEVTDKSFKFGIGSFTVELLNTEKANIDEKRNGLTAGANKDSIVTYLQYKGKYGTLLTGDMESQDEYRMVGQLSSRPVDVLKIAHHSWQSSTTMKFTKAINPKIAVVTSKYLLDDISTPVYYMQQEYNTKFYLNNNNSVVVTYGDSLSVSPSSAQVSNYRVVDTKKENSGIWKKLQNGIWFCQSNNAISSVMYDAFIKRDNGKWYYVGLQGNMMIGWIEVSYGGIKSMFYLGTDGAMITGWAQPIEISPYNNSIANNWYETGLYSHVNDTIDAWYTYNRCAWANGKNWFYFDSSGRMVKNGCYDLKPSSQATTTERFCFDKDGICISGSGCKKDTTVGNSSTSNNSSSNNSSSTKNGWLQDGGKWYYYSNSSKLTGWQKLDNGNWFYFNSSGVMQTGWLQDGGKWYYLDNATGVMLSNGTYTLYASGKADQYHFNADGVCDSKNC